MPGARLNVHHLLAGRSPHPPVLKLARGTRHRYLALPPDCHFVRFIHARRETLTRGYLLGKAHSGGNAALGLIVRSPAAHASGFVDGRDVSAANRHLNCAPGHLISVATVRVIVKVVQNDSVVVDCCGCGVSANCPSVECVKEWEHNLGILILHFRLSRDGDVFIVTPFPMPLVFSALNMWCIYVRIDGVGFDWGQGPCRAVNRLRFIPPSVFVVPLGRMSASPPIHPTMVQLRSCSGARLR